ncbi:GTP cyclohydrolase I, partial [Streptomyces albidoflavus]
QDVAAVGGGRAAGRSEDGQPDLHRGQRSLLRRLTTQIADSLMEILEPRGVIVVVECEHMCMTMRGVRKPGAKTITSAVRGQLRDAATRNEAMSLIMAR